MSPYNEKYTFLNANIFISDEAKATFDDLLGMAKNRNPDAFNMYIYNDYYPQALHDLVRMALVTIYSKVADKDWKKAFYAIEGLTFFFELESVWATCCNEELTNATNDLYGALLLEILEGLENSNTLSSNIFPNLENVLHSAYTFGESMESFHHKSDYPAICKTKARTLFKDTTTTDQTLYEVRLRGYAESIEDAEEKKEFLVSVEKHVKKTKAAGDVWYMKGSTGEQEIKTTDLEKAWNRCRQDAPIVPLEIWKGWDLTKWTEEDKKTFLILQER